MMRASQPKITPKIWVSLISSLKAILPCLTMPELGSVLPQLLLTQIITCILKCWYNFLHQHECRSSALPSSPHCLTYLDPSFKTSQLLIAGDKTFILHGSAFIQINYSLTVQTLGFGSRIASVKTEIGKLSVLGVILSCAVRTNDL